MATLKLPGSTTELIQAIYRLSRNDDSNENNNSSALKNGWAYTDSAILTGRPFKSGLIILAGYSGSGKSTLINVLLADENLCPTNSCQSETSCPTIITKPLCVTNVSPNIQGNLTFVDVPGSLDTEAENEVKNFAAVNNLFETMEDLLPRTDLMDFISSARPTVFPNMVLFVIRATDNRIIGNNTGLRKALEQLKNSGNIIDRTHPNLIVVITNVMHFGLDPEEFTSSLNNFKMNIRSVVQDVLGITDFDIIPVENKPKKFRLPARQDFYELPNEEISHYNLIQAMTRRFDKNKDRIGRLFLGWYLADDCPEKRDPPIVTQHESEISEIEIQKAAHILAKINRVSLDAIPVYNFQLLGYGYCPVTEEVKSGSLLQQSNSSLQEMKIVDIDGFRFQVPTYIKATKSGKDRFRHISYYEKEAYEERTASSYGPNAKLKKLVVNIGAERKWMECKGKSQNAGFMSFAAEMESVSLQLENLKDILKDSAILDEIKKLPQAYSVETGKEFGNFFREWGTHIIYRESLGGSLQLDCVISKNTIDKQTFQTTEQKIGQVIKELLNVSEKKKRSNLLKDLKSNGVKNQHIEFEGGNIPNNTKLEDINQKIMKNWLESISKKPVELRRSIKLLPFYILAESEKQQQALLQATHEYLQGCLKYNEEIYKEPEVMSRNEISKHSASFLRKVTEKVAYSVTLTMLTRLASSPQATALLTGLLSAADNTSGIGLIMQVGGIMNNLHFVYEYFSGFNWFETT